MDKFHTNFANCVLACHGSVQEILKILFDVFGTLFHRVFYKKYQVAYHKRAQTLQIYGLVLMVNRMERFMIFIPLP